MRMLGHQTCNLTVEYCSSQSNASLLNDLQAFLHLFSSNSWDSYTLGMTNIGPQKPNTRLLHVTFTSNVTRLIIPASHGQRQYASVVKDLISKDRQQTSGQGGTSTRGPRIVSPALLPLTHGSVTGRIYLSTLLGDE